MNPTPSQLGFHMPAEWELHRAGWLAWPYNKINFPHGVGEVEKIYADAISVLATSEEVGLLVVDQNMQERVASILKEAGADLEKVKFHIANYVSFWMRDI